MVKSLHRSLEAKLASIEDPEYENSDEEEEEADSNEPTTISKRGKSSNKRKKETTSSKPNEEDSHQPSSVIYLGHLPTAFEERELIIFLNQFGPVNKCRVSRSTKTGRSRGYAFVEFDDEDVAKIVADAMNGYFLLEKRLVCHVLPRDKVYDLMFKKPKKIMSKKDLQDKARLEVNKRRTPDVMKGITAKLVQREELKRKKLADLGIDYDFPGYAAGAKAIQSEEEKKKSAKKRKVSLDEKENSADEEDNKHPKTPKSKKQVDKATTEVKKSKKKKDKKRKSTA